jgi:hypothetical protein
VIGNLCQYGVCKAQLARLLKMVVALNIEMERCETRLTSRSSRAARGFQGCRHSPHRAHRCKGVVWRDAAGAGWFGRRADWSPMCKPVGQA